MTMSFAEWIGLFAGFCTTLSFLPQVLKIWKTKSAKDISLTMYTVICLGFLTWIVYGLLIGAPSIIITNVITLILAVTILTLKVKWKEV